LEYFLIHHKPAGVVARFTFGNEPDYHPRAGVRKSGVVFVAIDYRIPAPRFGQLARKNNCRAGIL
jgi:hypothetical protein